MAREANIVVDDKSFAKQLREDLEQALQKDARPVSLNDWNHASLARRSTAWFTYYLVRLTIGLTGLPDKA
ncbi:MAG: hypothetical protein A3B82_00585 [Methylophilales bacterium RIFCSPHIGHO2_02_FULL_57_10]|nr:MAG: hypothetical protein A3B82_00585 [Methylophilales bacterium RIFCSPHIGHO2_02_FULL_57_10]